MATSAIRGLLCLSALGLVLANPLSVRAEPVGTSCADCPSYNGAFSIKNETGQTIKYKVRWGENHSWKSIVLRSGYTETHSYPLGDNERAPAPHLQFDNIANDGRSTMKDYHMKFTSVGYGGYGSSTRKTEPKPYFFRYDGNHLDLFAGE